MTQTPKTNEKHLQNNTIDLLQNMGWEFIPPSKMENYRDNTNCLVPHNQQQGFQKIG
jgi:hypothetical protein